MFWDDTEPKDRAEKMDDRIRVLFPQYFRVYMSMTYRVS